MMKPPARTGDKGGQGQGRQTYAAPTPKVSRAKPGRVLSPAEKAAFIASRSDLKPKG